MTVFKYDLPIPMSGLKSTLSMGMNEDGELDEHIHLLGGCASPYVPLKTPSQQVYHNEEEEEEAGDTIDTIDEGGSSIIVQNPHEIVCNDISDFHFIFDPKNHTSTIKIRQGPPMPRGRHKHSAIAVTNLIWVLGGRDESGHVIHEIDIYDGLKEQWKTLSTGLDSITIDGILDLDEYEYEYEYTYGFSDACVFDIGSFIFITGGFDSEYNAMGFTIMIDTDASLETDKLVYEIKSSLNIPRGSCSAVSHANFAYVLGGFSDEDGYCEAMTSVEVYDFKSDSWTDMETGLNIGRANLASFWYQSKIVVVGGEYRGDFDDKTGRCLDDLQIMDGLTLGMNRKLPNRLTFPTSSRSHIEILDLPDSRPDPSQLWYTKKVRCEIADCHVKNFLLLHYHYP